MNYFNSMFLFMPGAYVVCLLAILSDFCSRFAVCSNMSSDFCSRIAVCSNMSRIVLVCIVAILSDFCSCFSVCSNMSRRLELMF